MILTCIILGLIALIGVIQGINCVRQEEPLEWQTYWLMYSLLLLSQIEILVLKGAV